MKRLGPRSLPFRFHVVYPSLELETRFPGHRPILRNFNP